MITPERMREIMQQTRRPTKKELTEQELYERQLLKNELAMEQFEEMGGDPSKLEEKPSAFERLLGLMEVPLAPIRGSVYNLLQKDDSKDVNVWQEVVKAAKGEERLQGADLAEAAGVENKVAKGLIGFGADVVLDPLTYLTMGYGAVTKAGAAGKAVTLIDDVARAAKATDKVADTAKAFKTAQELGKGVKAAKKAHKAALAAQKASSIAAKYGDDVGRLVGSASDVSQISKANAREIVRIFNKQAGKELGKSGGVKMFGQSLPGTEKAFDIVGRKLGNWADESASALAGTYRLGKHAIDKAFITGDFANVAANTNKLTSIGLKEARRNVAAGKSMAKALGRGEVETLKEAIPDERLRTLATLGIGRQLEVNPELVKQIQKSAPELSRADVLKMIKVDPEAFPKLIDEYMAKTGVVFSQADINEAVNVVNATQRRLANNLRAQQQLGLNAEFMLHDSLGSTGYVKGQATRHYSQAEKEVLSVFGIDAEKLIVPDIDGVRKASGKLDINEAAKKQFQNVEQRMLEGGLITDVDYAELAGATVARDYQNIAKAGLKRDLEKIGLTLDDPRTRNAVQTLMSPFDSDNVLTESLRAYDKAMSWWKYSATAINIPRFQLRNLYGNKFLQWSSGLLDLGTEKEAAEWIVRAGKALKDGKLHTLSKADRGLFQEFMEHGLISANEDILGIVRMSGDKLGKAPDKSLGKIRKIADLVQDNTSFANELVENQGRISAYLAARKQGLNAADAARAVDDTLFNYSPEMMTAFENQIMKRLIPFYTWMRRNTPKAFETLFTKPRVIKAPQHLISNMQSAHDIDKTMLPEYLREGGFLPVGIDDKAGNPIGIKVDAALPIDEMIDLINIIPTSADEVAQVPSEFARFFTKGVSPAVKIPLEQAGNFDMYYQQPIKSRPFQKAKAPEWLQFFAELLPDYTEDEILEAIGMYMDRTNPKYGTRLMSDPRLNHLLRNISPFLNTAGSVLADTPTRRDKTIGYLTGFKPYSYDREDLQLESAREFGAKISSAITEEERKRAAQINNVLLREQKKKKR